MQKPPAPEPATPVKSPEAEVQSLVLRGLKRYQARLERKLEALRGDLAEASRAAEFRRSGEALLAYLKQVPARSERVSIPDPGDAERRLDIDLDPKVSPQANAGRYFKRAARAERGMKQIPERVAATEREIERIAAAIVRLEATDPPPTDLKAALDDAVGLVPAGLRRVFAMPAPRGSIPGAKTPSAKKARAHELPAKFQPRRLTTSEGWEVMIGRSNEGNDYLTLHIARPEDYWFHVHGAAGSHVVLRRGKSKDEPSKQTIQEVASWAAFYSQARTAGRVPVIVTRKKYVRKPRGSKPGLVTAEREKTVMVKPKEPGAT